MHRSDEMMRVYWQVVIIARYYLSRWLGRQCRQDAAQKKIVRVKAGAIKEVLLVWQEDISLLNTLLESLQKRRERA